MNVGGFIGLVSSGLGEFLSQGGPNIGEFPRETIDHEDTEKEVARGVPRGPHVPDALIKICKSGAGDRKLFTRV